jgi:methylmalonyl-CoA/ethylmalonyl-CoA epimerase
VHDARATAERLSALFGVGPWRFEDWPPPNRPEFVSYLRGEPAQWRVLLAFADWGTIELELIECVEGENQYREFLRERGEGMHHLLYEVDDLEATIAEFEREGATVLMAATGRRPGTRWVVIDTAAACGFYVEVRNRLVSG